MSLLKILVFCVDNPLEFLKVLIFINLHFFFLKCGWVWYHPLLVYVIANYSRGTSLKSNCLFSITRILSNHVQLSKFLLLLSNLWLLQKFFSKIAGLKVISKWYTSLSDLPPAIHVLTQNSPLLTSNLYLNITICGCFVANSQRHIIYI